MPQTTGCQPLFFPHLGESDCGLETLEGDGSPEPDEIDKTVAETALAGNELLKSALLLFNGRRANITAEGVYHDHRNADL